MPAPATSLTIVASRAGSVLNFGRAYERRSSTLMDEGPASTPVSARPRFSTQVSRLFAACRLPGRTCIPHICRVRVELKILLLAGICTFGIESIELGHRSIRNAACGANLHGDSTNDVVGGGGVDLTGVGGVRDASPADRGEEHL